MFTVEDYEKLCNITDESRVIRELSKATGASWTVTSEGLVPDGSSIESSKMLLECAINPSFDNIHVIRELVRDGQHACEEFSVIDGHLLNVVGNTIFTPSNTKHFEQILKEVDYHEQ